jgi:uncharacterized protein (DUF1778 family)
MARPRLPKPKRKENMVNVRFNDDQLKLVSDCARKRDTEVSVYIRDTVIAAARQDLAQAS